MTWCTRTLPKSILKSIPTIISKLQKYGTPLFAQCFECFYHLPTTMSSDNWRSMKTNQKSEVPYSLILDMIVCTDFTNFCAASIWHEMIAWWLKLKYMIGYCKIRPWSKIPQIWYRKLVANGLFNQWLLVIHTFSTYLHIRVPEGP